LGIFFSHIPAQDQDALVVDVAGHICFALNINYTFPAHGSGCSNPGRLSEHIVAKVINSQAVDLTRYLTIHVNHEGAAINHLLQASFNHVRTINPGLDGLIHVFVLDFSLTVLGRPIVGLPDKIRNLRKAGGDLFLPAGHAYGLLYQSSYCCLVKGLKFFILSLHPDKLGKFTDRIICLVHACFKISPDLEDFFEVMIIGMEQLIQIGLCQKDYFGVHLNGLGFQT